MLVIALIVAGSLAWRVANLDSFSLSNDEGAYLMWAWLVHSGHPLYSETVSVSAPVFIVLLDLAFDLAGVSLLSGRAVALGCLALMLVTLAASARLFQPDDDGGSGWLAGVTAAVVFSVAPLAFYLSRMAMGEIPAVALATLAVLFAQVGARHRQLTWPALSGGVFGLSLLTKALAPLVMLPIAWLIVWGPDRTPLHRPGTLWRGAWGVRLAVWVAAAAVPVLACLMVYDRAAFYDQVVAFRFDLRAAYPLQLDKNLVWLAYFAHQQWGIVIWAAAAVGLLIGRRRWRVLGVLLLWLLGAVVSVLAHSPLFAHHTIIILPPLAILAGLAASETWRWWRARHIAWSGLGLAGTCAFLVALPGAVSANSEVLGARFGREEDAIALLERVTRPADPVISDNLLLAFMAGRQTPPPFGDVAQVAIDSRRQTSERLIAISEAYPVEAVANWALRLPYLDAYMRWVEDNYLVRRTWDNQHIIYFGRKVRAEDVPNARRVKFDDGLILSGYAARPVAGGNPAILETEMFWQAERTPTRDYTVFVHLYDSTGRLIASHDGPPVYGYMPTSQWPVGQVIPDRHDIPLPDGLPGGDYYLAAGLYDPATGARLALQADGGDRVDLVTIALPGR
jgi:hypothetical protein